MLQVGQKRTHDGTTTLNGVIRAVREQYGGADAAKRQRTLTYDGAKMAAQMLLKEKKFDAQEFLEAISPEIRNGDEQVVKALCTQVKRVSCFGMAD